MTEQEWIKKLNAVTSKKYPSRWDVYGNVYLNGQNLTELPIQFGEISGRFDCSNNKLTSLKGAPIEVGEIFNCSSNQLTTLKYVPKIQTDLYSQDNPLNNLNDLIGVEIKGYMCFVVTDKVIVDSFINALQNTNLDALEYIAENHRYNTFEANNYWFSYIRMNLEQIIIKKRLERIL